MQKKELKQKSPKKKLNVEVKTIEPRTATRPECYSATNMSQDTNPWVTGNGGGLVIGIN